MLAVFAALIALSACTTEERRFCGRQAGAGDVTCGPAVKPNDWQNANGR
jgi:hypothetical protein